MKLKNLPLLLIVVGLLVAPAGCIFSPDNKGEEPVDPTEIPFANTREQLMDNFEDIYTGMLIDDFREMLHEDYKTILLRDTLDEWGWADDFYFDYTDEVTIHTKIFGGEPGLDAHGNVIHPIDSIEVGLFELQDAWEPILETDLYFAGYDGWWGNYQVELEFNDADASHKYAVQQQVIFYVTPVEEDGRTKWLMLGQRGLPMEK